MKVFTFGPAKDHQKDYADGTSVPSRHQNLYFNGKKIGYIEIHMHKNKNPDGSMAVSFGITPVVEKMPEASQ